MPRNNPIQKIKDTTNMRNKAIEKFLKNRKPAEIKDVEEYNPKTGTTRMISLPGYSIAEQKRMKRDKAKKKTKPGFGG
jgi:hypothetical protein|tara:strand:+ start:299 stop:532 length:234 start_codon:yes stop_codon:yes gene_type:complete